MSFWGGNLVICVILFISTASSELLNKEQLVQINNTHFDYVILGGGTAGLVVASRLSEDPQVTVAVIEAGDFERNNPNVTTITASEPGKGSQVDWQYKSVPQVYGGNRSIVWSAGKGLGGSSLINGMTYMRPADSQIDLWPSLGLELDWQKLFNASKSGEDFHPPTPNLTAMGAGYEPSAHGYAGPLKTCISPHMVTGDIHEILNTTFKNLAIPPRDEFCAGDLRGFGVQATTQNAAADIREDAAQAYYYPVMNRPNLVAMVNTTATHILWSEDSSSGNAKASGAEVSGQNGEISTLYADREIILSAGAIRSPAILENSGVGSPSVLARQSIDVKVNLPSVGENFQDQTTMVFQGLPLRNYTGFPVFVAHASLHDLFGPNTSSVYESTLAKLPGYAATIAGQNGGASTAAVQEELLKSQLDLLFNSNTPAAELAPGVFPPIIGVALWPLQSFSRGSVHIDSTDKTAPPAIDAKFFQFDFDGLMTVQTARYARKLLTTPPLYNIINGSTLNPSFETVPEDASNEVWLDWIKTESLYQPNYHHLGTCAMLPKNKGGVVDNDFKVYGTENVRVVDLSVIPLQVAGHSTSLLYGVAEWASQKIKNS